MRQLGGEPSEVARVANTISQQDLTADIKTHHAHPRSIIQAMSHMQASLRKIVAAVRESSENVAAGSHRIASGNADLSARTDEQASQLNETAAAMEQLAVTVKNNVDDAVRARSEEHTSEIQSLMRNSYAVFCLKKKNNTQNDE